MANFRCTYVSNIIEDVLIGDQIRDDYELEVVDPYVKGRFRCCHALIDREQPDFLQGVKTMVEKVFQDQSYIPSGHLVADEIRIKNIFKILEFTVSLLRDERNVNRSKLVIEFLFGSCWTYGPLLGFDEPLVVMKIVRERPKLEQAPASPSAIEALEKVCVLGNSECAICFANYAEDKEAKRMPCGHVFHQACIHRWLNTNHLCPLCRYAMPRTIRLLKLPNRH